MAYGDGLYGDGLYGGAPLSAVVQNVFPPRVLVSLVGLVADSIETVTIYRIVGTTRTELRGAIDLDTTGVDAVVRVDGETPFGIEIQYVAVMVDISGQVFEVYSPLLTVDVAADYVISDAINALGVKVVVETWPDRKRTRESTTFNVNGRLVAVSKPRSSPTATVSVRTDTESDRDSLNDVLDAATSGVVLIRNNVGATGFDSYLAITDDTENRQWWGPRTWFALETAEVDPWAPSLEARGFTLGDIATTYEGGVLSDISDDFNGQTLLAIAQAEFTG